jgi:hypothetical protein
MEHACPTSFGLLGLALATVAAAQVMAQESAVDVVAVAVRDAGHACTDPRDAVRDAARSAPNEAAWTIRCDEGAYSVRFMGDTGAKVEPIP